jgi:hypothetical protein
MPECQVGVAEEGNDEEDCTEDPKDKRRSVAIL